MIGEIGFKDIAYLAGFVATGFSVWFSLKGRVQSLEQWKTTLLSDDGKLACMVKDNEMNDKRVRLDIGNQNTRNEKQFIEIEDDIKALHANRERTDARLIQIEANSKHTLETVDKIDTSIKQIIESLAKMAIK